MSATQAAQEQQRLDTLTAIHADIGAVLRAAATAGQTDDFAGEVRRDARVHWCIVLMLATGDLEEGAPLEQALRRVAVRADPQAPQGAGASGRVGAFGAVRQLLERARHNFHPMYPLPPTAKLAYLAARHRISEGRVTGAMQDIWREAHAEIVEMARQRLQAMEAGQDPGEPQFPA